MILNFKTSKFNLLLLYYYTSVGHTEIDRDKENDDMMDGWCVGFEITWSLKNFTVMT